MLRGLQPGNRQAARWPEAVSPRAKWRGGTSVDCIKAENWRLSMENRRRLPCCGYACLAEVFSPMGETGSRKGPRSLYGTPRHSTLLEKKLAKYTARFTASRTRASQGLLRTVGSSRTQTPITQATESRRAAYAARQATTIFQEEAIATTR